MQYVRGVLCGLRVRFVSFTDGEIHGHGSVTPALLHGGRTQVVPSALVVLVGFAAGDGVVLLLQ